jgi:glutamate racemase
MLLMKKFGYLFLAMAALAMVGCGQKKQAASVEVTPIMKKALNDSSSIFFANFGAYPSQRDSLPIGVFDSGTGGLTVLEVMLKADNMNNITGALKPDGIPDFAGEDFEYLGDQANMPYGNYSSEGKDDYLRELAVKDALFMLGNKYYTSNIEKNPKGEKKPVKIIVIACNTATAYGLKDIQHLLELSKTGVKVIGVINAGVNALFSELDKVKDKDSLSVGVMATVGTISSNAYARTIKEVAKAKHYKNYIEVVNQPGAGFAESVDLEPDFVDPSLTEPRATYRGPKMGTAPDDIKERLLSVYHFDFSNNHVLYKKEGGKYVEFQLNSAANYARFHLVSLFDKLARSKKQAPLKSVILGCTHYPFLLDTLKETINELRNYKVNGQPIYAHLISPDFTFIDPAIFTAIECYQTLRQDKQLALRARGGKLQAFISVPYYLVKPENLDKEGGLSYDFKFGRNPGTEDITTVFVPFSRTNIKKENLERIQKLVPHCYEQIVKILEPESADAKPAGAKPVGTKKVVKANGC